MPEKLTLVGFSGHRAAVIAALFLLYAAAVVWLTWPLGAQIGTHLPATLWPCYFDLPQTAWVLAHESRALTQAPATFANAPIYHPTPGALFYADAAFGALPFFLLPFLIGGNATLAVNLALLVPAAATALVLHLVARLWTGSHLAGFVAAWTFLTTRWALWEFGPTAPQYVALLWFPPIILLTTRPPSRVRDVGLAALIALQSLSSPLYVSAAILLPIGVIVAARLLRRGWRVDGLRLLAAMALAVLALVPVLVPYAAVRAANPDLAQQTYWRWWPSPPQALPWGPLAEVQSPTAVPLIAIGLAMAGALSLALPWRRRAAPFAWRLLGHAALWAVAGIVLSVGPRVAWNGVRVRIPQTLLAEWIPLYAMLRQPARLGIGGLMGLSLAAGLGFAACTARIPIRGRSGVAVATLLAMLAGSAMYADYQGGGVFGRMPLPRTYPTWRPSVPEALVQALRAGEGPVIELPVRLTTHGVDPGLNARAMYRAIYHRRPLLNGYGGYWPHDFIPRMQLAERLPDPQALAALRAETGLTTVVVNVGDLYPKQRAAWKATLASGSPGLRPLGTYDGAVILDARAD
jgi:hypothetical protein